ncbi:hypothetical protein PSSHI_10520 [Photobacterium sp. R1]
MKTTYVSWYIEFMWPSVYALLLILVLHIRRDEQMNKKTLLASLIITFSGHAYADNDYYEAPISSGEFSTASGSSTVASGKGSTAWGNICQSDR